MSDRRAEPRHVIPGELAGEVTIVEPLRVVDISRGGVRVDLASPLAPESLHPFRLQLGAGAIVVKGRVAHCRIDAVDPERVVYCAGVEFIEPPVHVRDAIAAYIDRLTAARAPQP
jgi:hypothetical protein